TSRGAATARRRIDLRVVVARSIAATTATAAAAVTTAGVAAAAAAAAVTTACRSCARAVTILVRADIDRAALWPRSADEIRCGSTGRDAAIDRERARAER